MKKVLYSLLIISFCFIEKSYPQKVLTLDDAVQDCPSPKYKRCKEY